MALNIPFMIQPYRFIIRTLADALTVWSCIIVFVFGHFTDAVNKTAHASIISLYVGLFTLMGEQLTISLTIKIAGNMVSEGFILDGRKQFEYTQSILARIFLFYPALNIDKLVYQFLLLFCLYRSRSKLSNERSCF